MTGKVTPRHIAFIMDGNGRWAKKRLLPRKAGHRQGVKALEKVVDACEKRGVEMVTFYAFSTENWARPQDEIDALFAMVAEFADTRLKEYVQRGLRILFIGDLTPLPQKTIVRAVRTLLQSGLKDVDVETLSDCMYTGGLPDPDVIVRSSGEKRLSNFMLWQAAYSEFVFRDELWPDFDEKIIDAVLEEYASRDRRYGSVKRLN